MTDNPNPDNTLIEGLEAEREAIARIIDPMAFDNHARAFHMRPLAYEKADAILTRASAKPDEDEGLMRADIVLISQSMSMSGFETHGLFPTFEAALAHVCKDEGLQQAAWAKTTKSAAEFVYRNTRWVASREPVRAALQGATPRD